MCPPCQENKNPHPDRACAFHPDGTFNSQNWNCETITELLKRAETNYGADYSVNVITHPEDEKAIILTRYKRRGKTSQACIIGGDDPAKELTLEDTKEFL